MLTANKTVYHWQSNFTGEVVTNFAMVIKSVWLDICTGYFNYRTLDWSYSKSGF